MGKRKCFIVAVTGVMLFSGTLFWIFHQSRGNETNDVALAKKKESKTISQPEWAPTKPNVERRKMEDKQASLTRESENTFLDTILGSYAYLVKEEAERYVREQNIEATRITPICYGGWEDETGSELLYFELDDPGQTILCGRYKYQMHQLNMEKEVCTREDILQKSAPDKRFMGEGVETDKLKEIIPLPETPVVEVLQVPMGVVNYLGEDAERFPDELAHYLQEKGIDGVTSATFEGNIMIADDICSFVIILENGRELQVSYTEDKFVFSELEEEGE